MMHFYKHLLVCALGLTFIAVNARADDAPVVDLNTLPDDTATSAPAVANPDPADTVSAAADTLAGAPVPDAAAARQSLPMKERVNLLEQQISNLTQMNLPGKIDNLEQQIHQLNGQMEEQTHTIQQLQDQQQKPPLSQDTNNAQVASATTPKKASSTSATPAANAGNSSNNKTAVASPIANAETAVVQNAPSTQDTATNAKAALTDSGGKAYQSAFDLMMKKQNSAAITAFQSFLQNYPDSDAYVPNAHYWLGELYSTDNKNTLASREFNTVIKQYPTNDKAPDAMLKLAIIHDDAGQHAQAKRELQKLVQQYPNSTAAGLAKMRLQGMPSTTTAKSSQ